MNSLPDDRAWPDRVTVAAVAGAVYVTASVVHEVLGHAVVGVLLGGKPALITSTHVVSSVLPAMAWQRAITDAAGGVANLAFGLLCWALGRMVASPWSRYFLWLSAAVNLFFCGTYVAASSLFNFGDWTDVANEFGIGSAGRIVMAVAGLFLCRIALLAAQRDLVPFLHGDAAARWWTARTLARTAWISGAVVVALSGVIGPRQSDLLYALGWTLGGTFWLLLVPRRVATPTSASAAPPVQLDRSRGWIAAGVVASILYIALLGPGIHFGTPRQGL